MVIRRSSIVVRPWRRGRGEAGGDAGGVVGGEAGGEGNGEASNEGDGELKHESGSGPQ